LEGTQHKASEFTRDRHPHVRVRTTELHGSSSCAVAYDHTHARGIATPPVMPRAPDCPSSPLCVCAVCRTHRLQCSEPIRLPASAYRESPPLHGGIAGIRWYSGLGLQLTFP
jgi:hypothetical protein